MASKLMAVLGSIRFWIVVAAAGTAVLNGTDIMVAVQNALIAVAGIGTLDSIASKFGGK